MSGRKERGFCSIEGCGLKEKSRGYCNMHYTRLLTRGNTNMSPGKLPHYSTHGHTIGKAGSTATRSGTLTYSSWKAMKMRCFNPNHKTYHHYGGKGITICDEWVYDFAQFLADMGERPEGMTLDRIDPEGNYEPGNCKWSTTSQQNLNRKTWGVNPKREGNMNLIENIDKEIKKAKAEVKALNAHVKALEQARAALSGLKRKKTTKSVKEAKKLVAVKDVAANNG